MANLLIRDLDERLLAQLKDAARAHGRSLQAEIHDALQRAGARHMAQTSRMSVRWRKRLARSGHSDSTLLIREDREGR